MSFRHLLSTTGRRAPALALLLGLMPTLSAGAQPALDGLSRVPMLSTNTTVLARALTAARNKADPLQFATGIALPATLADGLWDTPDADTARWRLKLHSRGARSLNLHLSGLTLPPSATLSLYDTAGTLMQGPYTARDVSPDGQLWTAIVEAETAVLELRVASSERSTARLALAELNHGFIEFSKAGTATTKSGSCNVDVACPLGDAWRDEIRSVARITVGGQTLCSAQLVNNVRQDDTPYLLTANHCGITKGGILIGSNAASVVAYWNYQNSSCRSGTASGTAGNGSLSQSQTGSTFKASDSKSDFTLVQLNSQPASAYNVFYAGWNNSTTATPSCGVAVHHPQGEEKRISRYLSASRQNNVTIASDSTFTVDAWAVNWSQGTTEAGSSGAGLYDRNHRLIGVLSGGDGACNNTGGTDYFARMDRAWAAGSASDGQLKAWLDPDNTGAVTLCGRGAGSAACAASTVDACSGAGGGSGGGGGGGGGALGLGLLTALLAALSARRACRA